jgi:RecA-family ATPase
MRLEEMIPSLEQIATPITAPVEEGPPDIIPGLLPRQGQLVIAGETNVGKSLVALEICSALTTSRKLWGELEPTMAAKKILYILGEHYNAVIQRLWQVTRLPMTDQVYLLGPEQLGFDKWLVAQGKQNVRAMEKFMTWAKGVDLIVFDPFSAFVTGIDVENDNIQMRLVLDSMSMVAQSAGASCVVLAHQGKPMMDKFGQEHHRKSYAIRGASAIEDAATNIFYLSKAIEGASQAAQRVAGDAQILSLTNRKYKGIAPAEYRLMRDPVTLNHTLLGNRPYVEVQRMVTQAKLGRMQVAFPDKDLGEIIKIVAAMDGVSERTIQRHLGIAT